MMMKIDRSRRFPDSNQPYRKVSVLNMPFASCPGFQLPDDTDGHEGRANSDVGSSRFKKPICDHRTASPTELKHPITAFTDLSMVSVTVSRDPAQASHGSVSVALLCLYRATEPRQ
ncbi:Uncharacterized protein HZ326_21018 [Fusarium oxysporum f. sp. albedinis]|nr:Uncharacterized protein HZ326_21018 [Fusarium oxysporum f. sp. albedinis]